MPMAKTKIVSYVAKRLVNSIFVLLVLSFLIFAFLRAIPGDPVTTLLGEEEATPEQYEALKAELGLDKPILIQYAKWIGRIAQGQFGTSIHTGRPVLPPCG